MESPCALRHPEHPAWRQQQRRVPSSSPDRAGGRLDPRRRLRLRGRTPRLTDSLTRVLDWLPRTQLWLAWAGLLRPAAEQPTAREETAGGKSANSPVTRNSVAAEIELAARALIVSRAGKGRAKFHPRFSRLPDRPLVVRRRLEHQQHRRAGAFVPSLTALGPARRLRRNVRPVFALRSRPINPFRSSERIARLTAAWAHDRRRWSLPLVISPFSAVPILLSAG